MKVRFFENAATDNERLIKTVETNMVPRIGEYVCFDEDLGADDYLILEVHYVGFDSDEVFVDVYVRPIRWG